jgi:hypothetical protein
MDISNLDPEIKDRLIRLINTTNERLDTTSLENASKAFNLGCSIILLPGILMIGIVLFLSHFNLVITALASVIIVIAVLLFANLVSSLARTHSMERLFESEIIPEIENELLETNTLRWVFDDLAKDTLPSNAPLLRLLEIPEEKNNDKRHKG